MLSRGCATEGVRARGPHVVKADNEKGLVGWKKQKGFERHGHLIYVQPIRDLALAGLDPKFSDKHNLWPV